MFKKTLMLSALSLGLVSFTGMATEKATELHKEAAAHHTAAADHHKKAEKHHKNWKLAEAKKESVMAVENSKRSVSV